jgi:hypothetical protein
MWKTLLLGATTFSLMATSAGAYTMIVVPTTPTDPWSLSIGDIASWDVFLDTEGESGITLFSFSRTFDPTVLAYRPDLSNANDDYLLYAPAAGKTQPANWLVPRRNPPELWPISPPIGGQINVEFLAFSLLQDMVATATRAYVATLSFEVVGVGYDAGEWSFLEEGNIFQANGVDVADEVKWVFVPEPTAALLVASGFFGIGLAARARRRV